MKFFSKQKDEDFIIAENENNEIILPKSDKPEPSHKLTVDEVLNFNKQSENRYDGKSALESLKKRMQAPMEAEKPQPADEQKVSEEPQVPVREKTLLEKCKPFITDDSGKDVSKNAVPLYKLESVAEILKNNSQKTVDRLAEKYDITVDDLGKKPVVQKEPEIAVTEDVTDTEKEQVIEINALFENVQSSVPFALSEVESEIPQTPKEELANTGTITFTPINNNNSKPKVVVTSNTQSIDLTSEITPVEDIVSSSAVDQITLEKSEFEEYVPEAEIESEIDVKKYLRSLSISKRNSFLSVSFSIILTLALAFMKLPFMTGLILGETKVTMIICTAITLIVTLLNMDMFLSIPKMFSKKSIADACPSVASIIVLAYAVMGIITGEIVIDLLLLLCIILSLRALGKFRRDSYMLSNLKQISATAQKNVVRLIDDSAVTFAMAKNSIEGDTLIAAPQKCDRITDFIKYSNFGNFLNGKLPLISVLSMILSILSGITAATYYNGVFHGLYAAAAIQCFASLPSLFFIKDFPLYSAAKRLNKKGCMIAGQMGATHIEMVNALVLNSADIFPSGTVTLHQMKILSENNLDETILRAASLTECLNSPLAPIFKRIAGESNITSLPDSDTIKYEERMGISGWVDDKLLFIGNRTLMEAHGISVPDIEVDRKILRNGYFPVYVAGADKVCALLVIQYSVDANISHELRRLTKIGVTVLVNNTDPNISDQMICDYLGLYEDSVMIMTNAGYHMFKNATAPKEACSAPASFRHGNMSIARIMNCANKIRRSNLLLTVSYIISAILGIAIFAYSSFAGSDTLISGTTVLLYSLICTLVSYILYLLQKP